MMSSMNIIIRHLSSDDNYKIEQSLKYLTKKTKNLSEVTELFQHDGFINIYKLLPVKQFNVLALSILANCCNLDSKWRTAFFEEDGISYLVELLNNCTDPDVLSRTARLLANLSKESACINVVQQKFIICSLIKHGCSENVKCQMSCLRALRIICTNNKSVKFAAESDHFPPLLCLLSSSNEEVVILCVRMICELLKTKSIEICYRVIDGETIRKIIQFCSHVTQEINDLSLEILFLLTLNAGCRVAVAMEGAIDVFVAQMKTLDQTESFKYATQGLCLCAREAVSRNKMKIAGVLPALVNILQKEEFVLYHESIVAAFVWFLFDDLSLGLLIRADVIPALLKYLDHLTSIEYTRCLESSVNETTDIDDSSDFNASQKHLDDIALYKIPITDSLTSSFMEQSSQWVYSSPETSPYYPNSPQYSIPPFSPHMSPNYSPPASPGTVESDINYSDNESSATNSVPTKLIPYHFQSADGIHAMIHGTRGPIHDILLLLSRFSQANDPSSFFLYLPEFNSLINYLLLSDKPNPKCARILNRLTLNSHCFDVMIKKKLTPRLYLRLCTGWTLEKLAESLDCARKKLQSSEEGLSSPEDDSLHGGMDHNLYKQRFPSETTLSLGQLLVSNLRSQSESSYGKGVLSHIFLTGSKELKETCVLSLPHILWSIRLQKRIFFDLKALNILLDLLLHAVDTDSETFVLIVEAVCALSRLIALSSESSATGTNVVVRSTQKVVQDMSDKHSPKHRKLKSPLKSPSKPRRYTLRLSSGQILQCYGENLSEHSLVFGRMLSKEYIDFKKPFIDIENVDENAFIKLLHFLSGCNIRLDKFTSCAGECLYAKQFGGAVTERKGVQSLDTREETSQCNKQLKQAIKRKHDESSFDFLHGLKKNIPVHGEGSGTDCGYEINTVRIDEENSDTSDDNVLCGVQMECSLPKDIYRINEKDVHTFRDRHDKERLNNSKFASDLLRCCERFFVDDLKQKVEAYLISVLSDRNVVELLLLSLWHHSSVLFHNCLIYLLTNIKCPLIRTKCFAEILHSQEKNVFVTKVGNLIKETLQNKDR